MYSCMYVQMGGPLWQQVAEGELRLFQADTAHRGAGSSLKGGPLCPLPDCQECDGGVTHLEMRYLGAAPAIVIVSFPS